MFNRIQSFQEILLIAFISAAKSYLRRRMFNYFRMLILNNKAIQAW